MTFSAVTAPILRLIFKRGTLFILVFFPGTPGQRQHVLAIIETEEYYTT